MCIFQAEVIAESMIMIPDTKRRLKKAHEDLQKVLVSYYLIIYNFIVIALNKADTISMSMRYEKVKCFASIVN